jgi:hypothetical protein
VIRALAPYLIASLALSAVAGGLYGAALIEVPALYAFMAIAIVVSLVGYVRWDERHRA